MPTRTIILIFFVFISILSIAYSTDLQYKPGGL